MAEHAMIGVAPTLFLVIAATLLLSRWGVPILFAYAGFHFFSGDHVEAGLALVFACYLSTVRGIALWLARPSPGRSSRRASDGPLGSQ